MPILVSLTLQLVAILLLAPRHLCGQGTGSVRPAGNGGLVRRLPGHEARPILGRLRGRAQHRALLEGAALPMDRAGQRSGGLRQGEPQL